MSTLRRRYRALSLVEILVTLAILLIGVLAVLRIFPRGLATLTRVSDHQEAIRLAEARMNELIAQQDALPDYILAAGKQTDTRPFLPVGSSTVNPGFGFLSALTGTEAWRPYDLDLPFLDSSDNTLLHRLGADNRLVVGERVLVGRGTDPTTLQATWRPYFTLFGPIGNAPKANPGDPDELGLAVFRDFRRVPASDLIRTEVTSGGSNAWRDRPVFSVADGGTDEFTQQPQADRLLFELDGSDRIFSVRCAYRDAYGTVTWAQLQPVVVPAEADPSDKTYVDVKLVEPQSPNADITQVVPESVQVRQVLQPDSGSGSINRFYYRTTGAANGVLYFAPSEAGETLSLEYIVEDWRNLTQTVQVQVDNAGVVTTGVTSYGGRTYTDQLVQLSTTSLDINFTPRLVAAASGAGLAVDQAYWAANPELARAGLVPLAAGVTLPPTASNNQSADVKVFYRRENNWLVAPSIAPTSYMLASDAAGLSAGGSAANFPVQSLLVDTAAVAGAASYTELQFRPSEAGRTVAVTYEYDPGNGSRQLASDELYVIPPLANRVVGGENRHAVVLRHPNLLSDSHSRLRILAVQGRSLQLRTCYDEDIGGRTAAPVKTTPVAGTSYSTAESMVELTTYVRRNR